jgi:hypothetical protein
LSSITYEFFENRKNKDLFLTRPLAYSKDASQLCCFKVNTAVVPVGPEADQQRMLKITRESETEFSSQDFGECAFVPFLAGLG